MIPLFYRLVAEKLTEIRNELSSPSAVPEIFDDSRQHGNEYDREDHQREVAFHYGYIAEVKSGEHEYGDPCNSGGDVIYGELPVRHRPDASDKGREGADNGDEARDHNGLSAVFFIEAMGPVQIFPV